MMEIITSNIEQSIKIIRLSGKIDTLTSEKLTADVLKAVEESSEGIIFDLKEVTFVSSSGIRMFLSAFKKGLAEKIKVAMRHVNPSIYKIFKVAGLESMFNIFDDELQALSSIWGISKS